MSILKSIRKYFSEQAYYIGFLLPNEINLSEDKRFSSIHWLNLNGYKNGWFADPFILNVSDHHVELFVEEWEYSKEKGRLCLLDIKREGNNFILEKVTPILELETHLSFPITIEHDGKLFVYPENYESGKLSIYEYSPQECKLINPIVIIERPLLDTQIIKQGNTYYALGVEFVSGEQKDTKVLQVYSSKSLLGPYEHIQTYTNELCEERGAGDIFEMDGTLYRPVQCCEGDYGKAVIIKELSLEQDGKISQKEINRIAPIYSSKYGKGLHTFNFKNDLYVIDGRDYRYRTLARSMRKILNK